MLVTTTTRRPTTTTTSKTLDNINDIAKKSRLWNAKPVLPPVEPVKYPCADYKPGVDDLQSFDFIRKFELDVNLDG